MAFDAIQICFGELNMRAEEHIMKAVQQVDVNVDKEKLIEAIKSKDFVDELIGYIFAYPDDDYMTMECLCRKLFKHGLIDKVDGYYQTHEIRTNTHECVKDTHDKTKPSNSEMPNNCEVCKHWEYDAKYRWWHCPLQDNGMYECHYEPRKLTAVEDEPTISKMEQVEEPQTEREG